MGCISFASVILKYHRENMFHSLTLTSLGHRVLVFTKRTDLFSKSSRVMIGAIFDGTFPDGQTGQ